MKHQLAAALMTASLFLAQLTVPGSYNLGIPAVPGTRVPESNPGTAVFAPPSPAPSSFSAPSVAGSSMSSPVMNSGPAYSFGAAPPPTVSPGR